jgi:hypothetical protein
MENSMNDLTAEQRDLLENIGDLLENVAREIENPKDSRNLFAMAWDIKQIARRGTTSENL